MSRTSAYVEIHRNLKRFHLNPLHFDPHGPSQLVLKVLERTITVTVQPRSMTAEERGELPGYEFCIEVSSCGQIIQNAFSPSVKQSLCVLEWILLGYEMNLPAQYKAVRTPPAPATLQGVTTTTVKPTL